MSRGKLRQARERSRIPLVRDVPADLDTPLSAYLKLANGPYSYLFESIQGGEQWGRYSIIGLPCAEVVKVFGQIVRLERDGRLVEETRVADPLKWIEAYAAQFRVPELPDMPRLTGGLVGYFGYHTVRYIEPRLNKTPEKPDPLGTPDILLMLSEELVVFDNVDAKLYVIVHADPSSKTDQMRARERLDEILEGLRRPLAVPAVPSEPAPLKESAFISGFTQTAYETAVEKIREYIAAGDVMQVVPSQRMSIDFKASPLELYRALRSLNPSPYMFCMNLGDFHAVGSSPEILVRLEDGKITLRPIAGTRPRGKTPEEDHRLEQELLQDPKEIAEHLMLIDLGRNDVGRVSKTGSVKVTERFVIEKYSHVMHIVSNVEGELREGMGPIDVLRATFPAGTLSGAPKVRALEIIDELEPVKRGLYSGAVGYVAWNGNMDTCIAIRTAVIKDGTLHIQAGAGIVADSVPRKEWEETMSKARGLMRAVALAQGKPARREVAS
ncbi:MAG: anthranilate synthase component I [Nevskiales bacterium]